MRLAHTISGLLVAAASSTFLTSGTANAASTEWQDIGGGKARLIAVSVPQSGEIKGGLEIKLNSGWKTYWRSPGDSGIPPQLDFSSSKSFAVGEIALPVPTVLKGEDVSYVGYEGRPVFRFDGFARGDTTKGKMALNLFLGVCEEVCIPAQASFELDLKELNRSDPQVLSILEQAEYTLPQEPSPEFKIQSIKHLDNNTLAVSALVPEASVEPQLFAEGPQNWYLSPGKLTRLEDNIAEFSISLDNIPKDAKLEDTRFRLTLAAGEVGIQEWRKIQP